MTKYHTRRKPRRGRPRVTVCIAAIYNNNAVLGASDRMVTGGYGDIEFEPPIPKILSLTNSICVMTAGDQNIQIQVYQKAFELVAEKININPEKWLDVSEVANIYSQCFYDLRNKLAENQILRPFNLTFDSFINRQKEMERDFIDDLTNRITRYQRDYMENIETIITGIDNSGPHIYVVRNGVIDCYDKLGFASIGIGSNHALSHFMFSAYSIVATESKALLTIHQAKKKAEVSPGVGEQTDICVIGPNLGTFNMITEIKHGGKTIPIVKDLDKLYENYKIKIKKLDDNAEEKIKDYLDSLSQIPPLTQQIGFDVSPSPSPAPEEG